MKLCTKSFDPGWDRIVDMVVKKDSLPDYVTDETVFKIILLEKGEINIKGNGGTFNIKAPFHDSCIRLRHKRMQNRKKRLKPCSIF